MTGMNTAAYAFLGLALAWSAWGQSGTDQTHDGKQKAVQQHKSEPSPGRQAANGVGNIAGGAGKGAGTAAKGVAKGAGDLVTLHPIDAATSVGRGAAGAGKDVGVGTVKGTGKIAKGVGRGIKHLF
jgi:hypothetical protein